MKSLYFYLHFIGNQQSCLYKKDPSVTHTFITSVYAVWNMCTYCMLARYAVRTGFGQVSTVYCITMFSWKQLCWFPWWSAGKITQISFSCWWRFITATSATIKKLVSIEKLRSVWSHPIIGIINAIMPVSYQRRWLTFSRAFTNFKNSRVTGYMPDVISYWDRTLP